ncbi:MAG: metallophosphoesterase, partial [Eubacterium sp.]|nr:metallophosphoesterase [Eubacterium sp.]
MKTNRTNFNGKRSFKIAVKRVLSSFIVFGMSLSLLPFEANAAGLPVVAGGDTINIGIASDIHINREDSASGKVREALLRQSLKGFYTATGNNLDAVAIAGDIADDGYVDELKTARSIIDAELASTTGFTAAMGNHEFYKYGWGASVDRNAGWKEEMQKDFTDNIKVPLEHDLNVKGIHILSVSPDNELDSYTARESFLKTHIEAAAQEDPTNPIIIVAHKPVKYTVMSSGDGFEDNYASFAADWSDSFLEFLKKYPQIIYFSAHAHDDLSNEDNIFQKDFTSVQDGAVCLEGASTGVIVSVNAAKQVTISRMNFSANTSYEPWIIDIPKVIESKENFKYLDTIKNINLTVGADASQIHVNWFNEYFKNGKVQYLKKAHMTDGTFSSLKEINAYGKGRVDYSTLYYNHALLTNLEENTEYVYRVGNDNGWSEYYTFKTPAAGGAFSFLFAADPQIGSTNVVSDAAGWRNTLDKALEAFPDTQILLTGGDHVDSAFSSSDYDGFFSPEQLTGLPIATVVGNHDISRIYSQHFAYSNVSPETSLKLTGENSGDYWFIRNNTLFLMLNSSVLDSQEHINFMQKAIMDAKKTGAEIKWKVAMFHYSIFSTAMHSDEEDIIKRREGLAPAFSDLQVDLVLMGHDHSYTRTYMMNGKNPVITAEVQNSVTDPEAGQVLYVTGSSSSGSKYYDYETVDAPYAAVNYNNKATSISNVAVSDTALTITTYNPKDMTVIDSFTINKTQVSGSDTLKPYLNIPTTNTVILNEPFDRLAGVSAIDNIDGDITNKIIVTGEVNTSAVGTYTLTYTITDMAGNTQTATREITVKKPADTTGSLYFGIDIKNGKLQNEEGSAVTGSTYTKTSGGYDFERDNELNQTVLCGPDKGNLRIDGLNLKALDNQFTIETYIKIPGDVTAYNVFQFEDQSINLVGRPCEGYPGETYFGAGKTQITEDADVYAMKKLPTDKWVHILCTAKEGEQTLYVNGERFSSDSYTKLDISTSSNDVLVLGGDDGERGGRIKFAGFRAFTNFVNDGQAKEIYTDRTKLKTPQNLKWDAGIPGKAVWETVENASSYTVQLYRDGLESGSAVTGIADTSYDFTQAITAEGVYTFKVTAMGKGTAYSNSDTSSKSAAYFYTTSVGALKPSISIPDANRVVLNGSFDKLADVSAEDRVDGDITDKITVSGDVNTSAEGEYTLTYTVKNSAGITASVTRRVVVKKYFYFGIDIKNGKLENEKYFKVTDSTYIKTGAEPDNIYLFERDGELGQNVLCGPAAENLVINKLNLKEFGNKFTVETYIKIPGNIGAYDVFQFDGQNVNLVGLPGETYFGSGKSSSGDADVYADKNLPVDQWIHVICTAKEGVQTLYVNGQKFSSDNYTGLNIAPTGYDELVLGGSSAGRSGLIKYAFFRVYSDFVTDEEAAELYTSLKKLS